MRTELHPEYPSYLRDLAMFQRCREAVAAWETDGRPIFAGQAGICWTPASARELAGTLSLYIQAYNETLWQAFPYCRACLGQCCAAGASTIELFDLLALALLDSSLPELPEYIPAGEYDCIYHSPQGCTWPGVWRTQKCWLFYCLGSMEKEGRMEANSPSVGERYTSIARALDRSIGELLPEPLRCYEQTAGIRFHDWLDRPLSLSKILSQALLCIFLNDFNRMYPLVEGEIAINQGLASPEEGLELGAQTHRIEKILAAIQRVGEEAMGCLPPDGSETGAHNGWIWEDLETLEWIVLGAPGGSAVLLERIRQRYAQPSDDLDRRLFPIYKQLCALALEIPLALGHIPSNPEQP